MEGGWRLERIRRLKLYLYIVQLISVVAIAILLIYLGQGFSLKPFYLPVNAFIYFVLLMGVVIAAESFYFRTLEIRFAESASSKYYMAKRFVRRAIVIIVICVIVIIILWVPFILNAMEEASSTSGTVSTVVKFNNKDPLGLSIVDRITITSTGKEANVYFVSEENYEDFKDHIDQLAAYRINSFDYYVGGSNPTFTFTFPDAAYGAFYIVVEDLGGSMNPISYTLHKSVSRTFLYYTPIFALAFIVVYAVAAVYLTTLRKKHAESAIYT